MVDFWGGVLQSNRDLREKSSATRERGATDQAGKFDCVTSSVTDTSANKPRSTLLHSVLSSSNDFFSGLHSKLQSALSLDSEEDDDSDSVFDALQQRRCAANRGATRGSVGDDVASSSTASELGGRGDGGCGHNSSESGFQGSTRHRTRSRTSDPGGGLPKQRPSKVRPSPRQSHGTRVASAKTSSAKRRSTSVRSKTDSSCVTLARSGDLNLNSDAVSSASNDSTSETETNDPTTTSITTATYTTTASNNSVDSSSLARSVSDASLLSWTSGYSCDSQADDTTAECMEFTKQFVEKLFRNNTGITLEEKSKFGQICQSEGGRLWFSRYVNTQRVNNKKVDESTFYSMVQYFAIALFECADADDYTPAKTLMNMCFTFYHEVGVPGCEPYKEFLYLYLREQPIWQSLRFWNAAFFDAVQCERLHKPVVTREAVELYSPEEMTDERNFQENITFGQLGSFTCNMHAFGLSRELCLEFLRKQSTIANLRSDQVKMLRDNIERMYHETDAWRI